MSSLSKIEKWAIFRGRKYGMHGIITDTIMSGKQVCIDAFVWRNQHTGRDWTDWKRLGCLCAKIEITLASEEGT
jgi:hypothetical protein